MKLKLGTILLIFLLFISGCVKLPEDLVAPNWDVDFNIPITNKSYKLADIIKPQKYINIDSDSSYVFSSDVYSYSLGVDEFLNRSNDTASIGATIIAISGKTNIYLPFPGNIEIVKAKFKNGIINIQGHNESVTDSIIIDLNFPGFKDQYGNILKTLLSLAPQDTSSINILLSKYTYTKPASQSDSLDNGILIEASCNAGSGLSSAHINFASYGIIIKSATGYFPPQNLAQVSQSINLNLGSEITNYRGNIYLTGSFLKLKAEYESPAVNPLDVELSNLQIKGKSLPDNQQKQLLFKNSSGIKNKTFSTNGDQPEIVDTTFDDSNSNISDFVAFLPDELVISTASMMNPDDDKTYRTITDQDSVKIESFLSTKGVDLNGSDSRAALKKSTLTDTLELNINQSDRDALSDGRGADISLHVKNAIPLTSWIKIVLADRNYNQLSAITTNTEGGDSLKFLGAQVNSSNGKVIGSTLSDQEISLNESQIKSLSEAYYVIVSVSVETSSFNEQNPTYVLLKASDWIELQARGRVKYNVNPGR